jgi:hypothetical protein
LSPDAQFPMHETSVAHCVLPAHAVREAQHDSLMHASQAELPGLSLHEVVDASGMEIGMMGMSGVPPPSA